MTAYHAWYGMVRSRDSLRSKAWRAWRASVCVNPDLLLRSGATNLNYPYDCAAAPGLLISSKAASRLLTDRIARGHRHHRHIGGDALAGARQGKEQVARHLLPKQPSPASALLEPLC